MICKLCKQTRNLRNSHILSEFLYRETYDAKHRAHAISSEATIPEKFIQKGLRERLLCEECEQKLSIWEHYFRETFLIGKGLKFKHVSNYTHVEGLDYKIFRLFELSILWRMSISALDFFSEVDLGTTHEERIRSALLNEDPLRPEDYPCFHSAVLIAGKIHTDGIINPISLRHYGLRCYAIYMCGLIFIFYVGKQSPQPEIFNHCITRQGTLILSKQHAQDIPFLREAIVKFGTAIKRRKTSSQST